MSKRVRATEIGYYGAKLRQPGDEFAIDSDKAFSEIWMEALDGKAPKAAKAEKRKKAEAAEAKAKRRSAK